MKIATDRHPLVYEVTRMSHPCQTAAAKPTLGVESKGVSELDPPSRSTCDNVYIGRAGKDLVGRLGMFS